MNVRKHRAPKGALRPCRAVLHEVAVRVVRKHRAPKGALRLMGIGIAMIAGYVRKHRAPKGALRQARPIRSPSAQRISQKAPSAKRCIKTGRGSLITRRGLIESESTERQKVH